MATNRKSEAPAKAKPKKPAEAELKPFVITGQLFGARYNEHGEVTGTEVMANIEIFKPNFSKVEQIIDKAVADAREAESG